MRYLAPAITSYIRNQNEAELSPRPTGPTEEIDMTLSERQEQLCDASRWNYSELRAIFLRSSPAMRTAPSTAP